MKRTQVYRKDTVMKSIHARVNEFVIAEIASAEEELVLTNRTKRELELKKARGEYYNYTEYNTISDELQQKRQFIAQAEALLVELNAPKKREADKP